MLLRDWPRPGRRRRRRPRPAPRARAGTRPTAHVRAGAKVPSPRPSRIETVSASMLTTATSARPSRSKSAVSEGLARGPTRAGGRRKSWKPRRRPVAEDAQVGAVLVHDREVQRSVAVEVRGQAAVGARALARARARRHHLERLEVEGRGRAARPELERVPTRLAGASRPARARSARGRPSPARRPRGARRPRSVTERSPSANSYAARAGPLPRPKAWKRARP